jgi:hypothetical protein
MKRRGAPVDNLQERRILIIKNFVFLHRHSEPIMGIAPTLISLLNIFSTSFSQLTKIFATLHGGYKVEDILMIDHSTLEQRC